MYRMCHVLQRGRKRVDELVRKLRQEADGVHVQRGHVSGQPTGVYRHVQSGEELIFRLERDVTGQSFDQRGLTWGDEPRHLTRGEDLFSYITSYLNSPTSWIWNTFVNKFTLVALQLWSWRFDPKVRRVKLFTWRPQRWGLWKNLMLYEILIGLEIRSATILGKKKVLWSKETNIFPFGLGTNSRVRWELLNVLIILGTPSPPWSLLVVASCSALALSYSLFNTLFIKSLTFGGRPHLSRAALCFSTLSLHMMFKFGDVSLYLRPSELSPGLFFFFFLCFARSLVLDQSLGSSRNVCLYWDHVTPELHSIQQIMCSPIYTATNC